MGEHEERQGLSVCIVSIRRQDGCSAVDLYSILIINRTERYSRGAEKLLSIPATSNISFEICGLMKIPTRGWHIVDRWFFYVLRNSVSLSISLLNVSPYLYNLVYDPRFPRSWLQLFLYVSRVLIFQRFVRYFQAEDKSRGPRLPLYFYGCSQLGQWEGEVYEKAV